MSDRNHTGRNVLFLLSGGTIIFGNTGILWIDFNKLQEKINDLF